MAFGSLLALLDDIAVVLDDVAVMTKVAAKKTAGVLGDDLALNAQQVAGVAAERELPVVWAVAKGSAKNKLIIVPVAILLSIFLPALITPLLMLGGLFLCYEGFEKVSHKLLTSKEEQQAEHDKVTQALLDDKVDLVQFEQEKIKGAIRTDFILSAEIVVIALGSVQQASLTVQIATVCAIAVIMTVGVYALVGAIVKLDDAGLMLMKDKVSGAAYQFGRFLLWFAPRLMKTLTIVGTIAMFLVGGGILVHGLPFAHDWAPQLMTWQASALGGYIAWLVEPILNLIVGLVAGALSLLVVGGVAKVITSGKPKAV